MSSETSSDKNINYLDTNGKKLLSEGGKIDIKRQTSDTDYYFDMVANKDKVIIKNSTESESSKLDSTSSVLSKSSKSSSKSSSSSSSSRSSSNKKSETKSNVETLNFANNLYSPSPPQSTNFSSAPQQASFFSPPMYQPSTQPSQPQPSQSSTHQKFSYDEKPNVNFNPTPILMNKTLPPLETTNTTVLSPQEIRIKKIELLRRLSEIKAKGFNLTKEYDFSSSIEEMEYEYGLLKSFADKRNGIKLYKSFLLNGVSLIEFANDKYDPFDFKLQGWSEHMSVEVDSYDDVLEEIYEKYKTTSTPWPPEVKLALLIIASGAGFHFTKSQLGGVPKGINAGSFLSKMMTTPETNKQYMSPQELNLENQKKMLEEREMQIKQKQKENLMKSQGITTESEMNISPEKPIPKISIPQTNNPVVNNLFNMGPSITQPIHRSNSRDIPDIRAPENVQEILNRIKNIQTQNGINTTETQEENSSHNDRLLSDVTMSASTQRKRASKAPKKPLISIAT